MHHKNIALVLFHYLFHSQPLPLLNSGWQLTEGQAKNGCKYVALTKDKHSYKFMEQNPNKRTVYAMLAREGHEIGWLFQRGPSGQYHYVAPVVDGRYGRI